MYKDQFTPFKPYHKVVILNKNDVFVVKAYNKGHRISAETEDEFTAQCKLAFDTADTAIFKAMGA